MLVYFEPGKMYRTGDFWTVPARTATGDVEWPTDAARRPLLQSPMGIQVHYAPLAWVLGEATVPDLRMTFAPLAAVIPAADEEELAAEAAAEAEATAAETAAAAGSAPRPAGQDDEGQPEN